jgi:hypothetical protein
MRVGDRVCDRARGAAKGSLVILSNHLMMSAFLATNSFVECWRKTDNFGDSLMSAFWDDQRTDAGRSVLKRSRTGGLPAHAELAPLETHAEGLCRHRTRFPEQNGIRITRRFSLSHVRCPVLAPPSKETAFDVAHRCNRKEIPNCRARVGPTRRGQYNSWSCALRLQGTFWQPVCPGQRGDLPAWSSSARRRSSGPPLLVPGFVSLPLRRRCG